MSTAEFIYPERMPHPEQFAKRRTPSQHLAELGTGLERAVELLFATVVVGGVGIYLLPWTTCCVLLLLEWQIVKAIMDRRRLQTRRWRSTVVWLAGILAACLGGLGLYSSMLFNAGDIEVALSSRAAVLLYEASLDTMQAMCVIASVMLATFGLLRLLGDRNRSTRRQLAIWATAALFSIANALLFTGVIWLTMATRANPFADSPFKPLP